MTGLPMWIIKFTDRINVVVNQYMNILILGSGGREHAFAWKLAQSPLCGTLFVAPGNAGTAQVATNLSIRYNDFKAVASGHPG